MKANIALLHHDLEWTELTLVEALRERSINVDLFDVRKAQADVLVAYDMVLNRVYASVANRDYPSIHTTLRLVFELTAMGVSCVNSAAAARADYDKYYAYERMRDSDVMTPDSRLLSMDSEESVTEDLIHYGSLFGYPFILKRNTGGRGKGLHKVHGPQKVREIAHELAGRGYGGAWIVQRYIKNVRGHDCRISIVAGQVMHAYGRSLIKESTEDHEPWLASRSRGSSCFAYSPKPDEVALAVAATAAIGADINEVDMTFAAAGPVIIENNPTPQYISELDGERFPRFVDGICGIIAALSQARAVEGVPQ